MKKILSTITFCIIIASNAVSENFYGGVGYLKSEVNTHKYSSLTYDGYDDKDDGFTLFFGYNLNNNISFEVGYNDLGNATASVTTPLTHEKTIKVYTLAGVLKSNPVMNDKLVFFAKAGFAEIKSDETLSDGNSFSKDTTNAYYGLGLEYNLNNDLALRALYEDYGKDDGTTTGSADPDQIDPNAISISIIKKF